MRNVFSTRIAIGLAFVAALAAAPPGFAQTATTIQTVVVSPDGNTLDVYGANLCTTAVCAMPPTSPVIIGIGPYDVTATRNPGATWSHLVLTLPGAVKIAGGWELRVSASTAAGR